MYFRTSFRSWKINWWFSVYTQTCAAITAVSFQNIFITSQIPIRNPIKSPLKLHSLQPLAPTNVLCPFWVSYKWNYRRWAFWTWLLAISMFLRFIHISGLSSFLWLNNIPLYGYTTLYLSTLRYWTFEFLLVSGYYELCCYKHCCNKFSILWDIYLRVELQGLMW